MRSELAGLSPELRKEQILTFVQSSGVYRIQALAEVLGVSGETIRRDAIELEERGQIRRSYGCLVAVRDPVWHPHDFRVRQRIDEKEAIGRLCSGIVRPGSSVFVTAGTTALEVARVMRMSQNTKFMTNMPEIGILLSRESRHEVRLTGGRINPLNHFLEGDDVLAAVRDELFDYVIAGTSAIDVAHGLLDHSHFSSRLRRVLRQQTDTFITVCDFSKFVVRAPHKSMAIYETDYVITDRQPPEEFSAFIEAGVPRFIYPGSGVVI